MSVIKLSERLLTVASYVEVGSVVADIGSDHAYLPIYLIQKGIVEKAVAGEVIRGPFETAKNSVNSRGVADKVTVRLADGLYAIEENDEIDTVTIAGMGGSLIATILEQGKNRLIGVRRLILQPNLHAKAIRKWAVKNNWKIVAEEILKEDKKIYEVLVLEQGQITYNELELLVGPFLLTQKNEVFHEKWEDEIKQLHLVLKSLENAVETQERNGRKENITEKLSMLKKVLER